MRKLLSIALVLSGLMPLSLGILILANKAKAIEMLKITDSPDMTVPLVLFGVCLIPLAIIQFLAAFWCWKGCKAGITLARLSGICILFSGIVIMVQLHRNDLALPDIIKGALILILGLFSRSKKEV